MTGQTIRLQRLLRAPSGRVFRAFVEPGAMCKWMPPHGYFATVHEMDVRVGGWYRMSFTSLHSGRSHQFTGHYEELVPGARLRYTDRFLEPNLPAAMSVTVSLRQLAVTPPDAICAKGEAAEWTDLTVVQEGIPEMIPIELCQRGWQESMDLLAQLVEAEIP
ncbi:MAG: SRPBCC domain-containing protein [Planctomycetaceae bacterium]|jgi:uncharacterized protein YndB with AHSA1/START domain|nr:SRPBCC domain-containing protein [Phycisphaerales bacterium]MCE2652080.1 SRPBCC domain-containing protein [Planctomycetaceae bacterium]